MYPQLDYSNRNRNRTRRDDRAVPEPAANYTVSSWRAGENSGGSETTTGWSCCFPMLREWFSGLPVFLVFPSAAEREGAMRSERVDRSSQVSQVRRQVAGRRTPPLSGGSAYGKAAFDGAK